MEQYRFKTEQEFINEHGKNWRDYTDFNEKGRMDYLLGTIVPNKFINAIKLRGHFKMPNTNLSIISRLHWVIKEDMLVKELIYKNGVMMIKNGLLKKS